jgi:hypothetical protein
MVINIIAELMAPEVSPNVQIAFFMVSALPKRYRWATVCLPERVFASPGWVIFPARS